MNGRLAGLSGSGKIAASITIVVGSLGVILSALSAFGLSMTEEQITGLVGIAGVIVALCGLWLNPGVPVGVVSPIGMGAGQPAGQSAAIAQAEPEEMVGEATDEERVPIEAPLDGTEVELPAEPEQKPSSKGKG